MSIYDKSIESTINLIGCHLLAQLWNKNKPVRTATTDKTVGLSCWLEVEENHFNYVQSAFWKTILYHRELYISSGVGSGGSILDSPHYVRADCQAPENSVLHHLLHHQKLTSEDKTNFYRRLLNR